MGDVSVLQLLLKALAQADQHGHQLLASYRVTLRQNYFKIKIVNLTLANQGFGDGDRLSPIFKLKFFN